MIPNFGACFLWNSPLIPLTFWVEIDNEGSMGCSRGGGRGGNVFLIKCYTGVRYLLHSEGRIRKGWVGEGSGMILLMHLPGRIYIYTVSAKKNAHFFKLVAELCQFLGGS
jgi:hypothetical protein